MTRTAVQRLRRGVGIGIVVAALGAFGIWNTADHGGAQEIEDNEAPKVRPDELELYIKVYKALQDDHDLTIENALPPYHTSLDDFRQIERRIQNDPRLVDKVRESLLEHARSRGAYARIVGTPTAPPRAQAPQGGKSRP